MNTFEVVDLEAKNIITAGLDYYKLTMGQFEYYNCPNARATWSLINRDPGRPLLEFVEPEFLQERFSEIRNRGFDGTELTNLANIKRENQEPMFSEEYLEYLYHLRLPEVNVGVKNGDLDVTVHGEEPAAALWETVKLNEISERYYENWMVANGIDPIEVYNEGDRLLSEGIALLKAHPEVLIADYGTRRRYSLKWHMHILERLIKECPQNLYGTSNVYLAQKYGLKPIGTMAHQLIMLWMALHSKTDEDLRNAPGDVLDKWYDFYGPDQACALTDTVGTPFFIDDFGAERSRKYHSLRHDSGDPFKVGDNFVEMYKRHRIDPAEKNIVFSDGLTIVKAIDLSAYFSGIIQTRPFGIGGHLTNNVGVKSVNFVSKLIEVDGEPTVKTSDVLGKELGPPEVVRRYKRVLVPRGILKPVIDCVC